jgi:hypothetical protein
METCREAYSRQGSKCGTRMMAEDERTEEQKRGIVKTVIVLAIFALLGFLSAFFIYR